MAARARNLCRKRALRDAVCPCAPLYHSRIALGRRYFEVNIQAIDIARAEPVYRTGREEDGLNAQNGVEAGRDISFGMCRDEYQRGGGETGSAGLYEIKPDGEGGLRVSFDGGGRARESDGVRRNGNEDGSESGGKKAERSSRCTANTDGVDREIERLKKEKENLERSIRRSEDENEREQLRRRLESVTAELAEKDNDAYRRAHTLFS